MNLRLLDTEVQQWLRENTGKDLRAIALNPPHFEGITPVALLQQLDGLQRSREKLPTLAATAGIYYPPKLNLEQTSSERTARYKASLAIGNSGLDLTGGLGVDSFFFAQHCKNWTYCEQDPELSRIAAHNFECLGAGQIQVVNADSIKFLEHTDRSFDTLYADPARRDAKQGKVFRLEDCTPDLLEHLDLLLGKCKKLIVKTAPLLDIQLGARQFGNVARVHVLGIQNEVKELLWELIPGSSAPFPIHCLIWGKNEVERLDFSIEEEATAEVRYGPPANFLYEPNATLLKAGCFRLLSSRFGLDKLAPNTHLYTGNSLIEFPGRRFHIEKVLPFSGKVMKRGGWKKANITTRNFSLSVAELRKRYKIADGGEEYLFFTTTAEGQRLVLQCRRA